MHASQHHQVSKRSPRPCPPAPNPAIYQAKRSLDKPFHISTVVRKFSLTGWEGGEHYRQIARPFDWTFTRADLERVLAKVTEREPRLALAA